MITIWQNLHANENKATQIVAQLRELLAQQQLQAGDKLPPQRQLAEHLGVTVGTISRAYAQAEKQGLIESKTGSGSYVKAAINYQKQWGSLKSSQQHIGLWQNSAFTQARAVHLMPLLQNYAQAGAQLDQLLDNDHSQNLLSQREQVCTWLNQDQQVFHPEQLFFSYGAQHGLNLSLIALQLVGERVLCEELCYPGLITLAKQLNIELKGLSLDQHGICPESLLRQIEKYRPRAIYLTPTLQNPTTAIMPETRRQQIIDICQRHQVIIIEDDVCGLLPDQRPPTMVEMAPQQVIYLNSFSKGAFKGLRFAYLHVPSHLQTAFNSAIRGSSWNISPLLVDLAVQWIQAGYADQALIEQRRLIGQRAQLLHHHLAGLDYDYQEGGLHCWLRLPASWRCAQFVNAAREQGVELASAEHFVVDNQASPNAVRISLGQADSNLQLDHALAIVAKLLKNSPLQSPQIF